MQSIIDILPANNLGEYTGITMSVCLFARLSVDKILFIHVLRKNWCRDFSENVLNFLFLTV